jgi:hypothetical protein
VGPAGLQPLPAPRTPLDLLRPHQVADGAGDAGEPALVSRAVRSVVQSDTADRERSRVATDTVAGVPVMHRSGYLLAEALVRGFSAAARNAVPLRPLVAHALASSCSSTTN